MAFLELTNIYKTYENAPLLRGVSFTVERGRIACLLGPSGSGKTTLLRVIAGLEPTESGRVVLDGEDLTGVPAHRRGIVLMFQDYALFPHKTAAENVAFGLRMRPERAGSARQAIVTRVGEMLALVGLAGFGDRDVNELSGGERQRVALARSLAPRPRLLLLDEPLGALDRNLRERLLEELPVILRRVGVTAITVTHDQEEAFALADHVVLIHEGQVIQAGRPETVHSHPANPWVARFLGLDNLFPATVVGPQQVAAPFGALIVEGEDLPAAGAEGMLLIHPWGITIGRIDPPRNAFTAQVTQRVFHGQIYRLTLALTGGTLHLTHDPGKSAPAVGETVTGWIDPAALRWLAPMGR